MVDKALTLSIVIPAHNEEGYLKACLDSISGQSEMPDEVFVIDNNSSDKTAEIAVRYTFVTLLKEKHQGIVFARNRGFNAAKSDLIGRIDADTVLSKDWVKQVKLQYRAAGSPARYAATAPSGFQNAWTHRLWYPLHRIFYFWSSRALMGHHTLSGCNMFITRKLWQEIKNEVCLRTDIHEDMDLAHHIQRHGINVDFVKTLENSMAGRKVWYKLLNYPSMWIKVRLVEH